MYKGRTFRGFHTITEVFIRKLNLFEWKSAASEPFCDHVTPVYIEMSINTIDAKQKHLGPQIATPSTRHLPKWII
jgi:hypothetical protein